MKMKQRRRKARLLFQSIDQIAGENVNVPNEFSFP